MPSAGTTNRPIRDHHFLLYCNSGEDSVVFTLPGTEYSPTWEPLINTAGKHARESLLTANGTVELTGKSLLVLRAHTQPASRQDDSVEASIAAIMNHQMNLKDK